MFEQVLEHKESKVLQGALLKEMPLLLCNTLNVTPDTISKADSEPVGLGLQSNDFVSECEQLQEFGVSLLHTLFTVAPESTLFPESREAIRALEAAWNSGFYLLSFSY